jgi:tartrate/fumarate subfamily iron-sulfur-dependent hydro-lyase alpha chain
MPDTIDARIAEAVAAAYERSAVQPSRDGMAVLTDAYNRERNQNAREALKTIIDNVRLAAEKHLAMDQTFATPGVYVKLGTDFPLAGDLYASVRRGCELATERGFLRPSVVDLLSRKKIGSGGNVGREVPAIELELAWKSSQLELTTFCTTELPPSGTEIFFPLEIGPDGLNIKKRVLEKIIDGGGHLCPPTCIAIGIGGSLSIAARLSVRASLRGWQTRSDDEVLARWEDEILSMVNELGIGPFGLGGDTTSMAVNIEAADTHAADIPVAIQLLCWACSVRRARVLVNAEGEVTDCDL